MLFPKLNLCQMIKGAGCDGVRQLSWPLVLKVFVYQLLFCRRSLGSCVYPTVWKRAQIIPLLKKGSKSCIENYWPISIVIVISKIFVVDYYRLMMKMTINLVLFTHQYILYNNLKIFWSFEPDSGQTQGPDCNCHNRWFCRTIILVLAAL